MGAIRCNIFGIKWGFGQEVEGGPKTSNSKHQTSKKLQTPSSKEVPNSKGMDFQSYRVAGTFIEMAAPLPGRVLNEQRALASSFAFGGIDARVSGLFERTNL